MDIFLKLARGITGQLDLSLKKNDPDAAGRIVEQIWEIDKALAEAFDKPVKEFWFDILLAAVDNYQFPVNCKHN